jgi:hypothetical protein
MLMSRVVVGLGIQIQVGVSGLLVHGVDRGAVWSSVYFNIQEGKAAIRLSLHGETDVGMDVVEVVKEIICFG